MSIWLSAAARASSTSAIWARVFVGGPGAEAFLNATLTNDGPQVFRPARATTR